jgi:hypothetical protein
MPRRWPAISARCSAKLIELDHDIQGAAPHCARWDGTSVILPAGVQKSAMKALSALMTDADEIVSF